MVALLTLTVNSYFRELEEKQGKPVVKSGQRIRAAFPINTRKRGEDVFREGSPHNVIAQGLLRFYTTYNSRTELVWRMKRQLDKIKLSPSPFVQQKIGNAVLAVVPRSVSTKLFSDFASTATSVLSNVAGPKDTAKFAGYDVDDLQFLISAAMGCYFGLLSYNGKVSCGICMDETTSAIPEDIAKHWKPEFEALYEEAMKYEGKVPNTRSAFGRFMDKL